MAALIVRRLQGSFLSGGSSGSSATIISNTGNLRSVASKVAVSCTTSSSSSDEGTTFDTGTQLLNVKKHRIGITMKNLVNQGIRPNNGIRHLHTSRTQHYLHISSPFHDKQRDIRRVKYPFQSEIERYSWQFLHEKMIDHFRTQRPELLDTMVTVRGKPWPRYMSKEDILYKNKIPCLITRYGADKGVLLDPKDIFPLAFDEERGHLSHLFKARLFRIAIENEPFDELCYVQDVKSHMVQKQLYFVRFQRHVPYKYMAKVNVPVTLTGVYGSPGQLKGGHIELAMPTIACEVVGEKFPPPFLVDCSELEMDGENDYGRITLDQIEHLLEPFDGLVRFSREYSDPGETEIVMCYDIKSFPERPLPADYEDPNFIHRQGKRYHLTYTGYWPQQTTRD